MIHRPRRSTFFPYTTLFRSEQRQAKFVAQQLIVTFELLRVAGQLQLVESQLLVPVGRPPPDLAGVKGAGQRPRSVSRRDRKSTRLNSSHGYISYAVFCLKKK